MIAVPVGPLFYRPTPSITSTNFYLGVYPLLDDLKRKVLREPAPLSGSCSVTIESKLGWVALCPPITAVTHTASEWCINTG